MIQNIMTGNWPVSGHSGTQSKVGRNGKVGDGMLEMLVANIFCDLTASALGTKGANKPI